MTTDRDTTRVVRVWLEDGVQSLPDRVLGAVLADLPTTPQRRPWRRRAARLARAPHTMLAAAAVLVLLVAGGVALVGQPARLGGAAGQGPSAPASPSPSPTPTQTPTPAPGYGTAPPSLATPAPLAPASALPSPPGSSLTSSLVGRQYNVDPPVVQGGQALVLTLRAADDPHCLALYGGRSTCFTILWTPNYPLHQDDPGVRGPARIVGGELVLGFALVPNDPTCRGTSSTYSVGRGGDTLLGIRVPACSFQAFSKH